MVGVEEGGCRETEAAEEGGGVDMTGAAEGRAVEIGMDTEDKTAEGHTPGAAEQGALVAALVGYLLIWRMRRREGAVRPLAHPLPFPPPLTCPCSKQKGDRQRTTV